MASIDYAAAGDNVTRELGVLMINNPEARKEMMKVREAGQCAQKVYEEYEEEASKDEDEDSTDGFDSWDEDDSLNFAADPLASGQKGYKCFDLIDRFLIGEISGQLFGSFFAHELMPLI